MNIIHWKIYYGDDTVYTSNDGTWEEAPDTGVQVVMLYFDEDHSEDKPYREIIQGGDFYCKDGDSIFSEITALDGNIQSGSIKTGTNIDLSLYESIVATSFNNETI